MLIMINQGCTVAVTLGSDDPIWGQIPILTVIFALRTCYLCHHLISQEQKHLLLVLKIVMDLCRGVRGEKDQI